MFYIPKMMFKNIKVQKLPYQGKRKKHEKYTQFNWLDKFMKNSKKIWNSRVKNHLKTKQQTTAVDVLK